MMVFCWCEQPAWVESSTTMHSTDGTVIVAKFRCLHGHWWNVSSEPVEPCKHEEEP